jgi:hypothetical protein
MSDDLAPILTSIYKTQRQLLSRIEALERRSAEGETRDWGIAASAYGTCRPTDPPSTSIEIAPGWVWDYVVGAATITAIRPYIWSKLVPDIAPLIGSFTNAYYYRWCVVAQRLTDNAIGVWEATRSNVGEFENPEAAIRHLYSNLYWTIDLTDIWADPVAMARCVLLVKNNGTTGSPGEIEPITLHDRSKSSFILSDARPWMTIVER